MCPSICYGYDLGPNAFIPKEPWNLPVVPIDLFDTVYYDKKYAKPNNVTKIPKNFWINFREIPPEDKFDEYYLHLRWVFNRSPGWTINFMDEKRRDIFMETYFAGTSILWVYNMIDDIARVAASDIWRYCALYAFGGLYLDDDAYIGTPLDEV